MGLFGAAHAKGDSGGGFNWGNAALAFFGGDEALQAIQRRRALEAQTAHQQQEAQTASDQSRMWQEGMAALGYSKPEIMAFAAHPESAAALVQARRSPYNQSPNETHVIPGIGGAPDQRNTAPPAEANTFNWLRDPTSGVENGGTLAQAFAQRTALPPPVAIAEGGGLAGVDPATGGYDWRVRPASMGPSPAPQTPHLPGGPPPSAPRLGSNGPPRAYGEPVAELTRIAGVPPSSGFRTQGHQDSLVRQGLTRARHSQHTERNALDFPIPAGPRQQAAAEQIRQRYPQAQFAFEATNLHVTLPGWGQAPDVSGSARRFPGQGAPRMAVRVNSPQEASGLPPGTHYSTPDGREFVR